MPIRIQGAAENNLQNVDVDIPGGLTVITGVSGSGKTSLVFDTLYQEARRRFLESFAPVSSGLRLRPAQVRNITGLGPAVAVGQNLLNRNPNSTLATASGLHPFLRLLYARFGVRHCEVCGAELTLMSADELVERLAGKDTAQQVFIPLVHRGVGSHRTLLALLAQAFGRDALQVDGRPWTSQPLDGKTPHDIDVLVGELPQGTRAAEARQLVEHAAGLGATSLLVREPGRPDQRLSRAPQCVACGAWFGELDAILFHTPCPHCQGSGCERCSGSGLHPQAAAVTWLGRRLPDLLALAVTDVRALFQSPDLPSTAGRLCDEITRRLDALVDVGLGYVTLDRPSPTLSRGEAQRVRLAVALISRLEDMLHVLDEPTVGQHPADVARLLPVFRRLNGPVVFVEHDRLAAATADHAIDLGPGAGSDGGRVVFAGSPAGLWQAETSTGRYFSLRARVDAPEPRPAPERFLTLHDVNLHNLEHLDVSIPLGRLTLITGVSGSGKSTLVEDVLAASLQAGQPLNCSAIDGPYLQPVLVDQSPIGVNPRSNAATYTGLANLIRDLYAAETGLTPSHFSFNRPEGACPTCGGMGAVEVKMRYLPSTWIPCADCKGRRFSDEVLAAEVVFGESALTIADFFALPVEEAFELLENDGRLMRAKQQTAHHILAALLDVGLGYLTLGQPSPTLSGGEAQRVKLTKYLGKGALAGRLLVLDEPSTGLHPRDVAGLLVVLDRLVRQGATVVVVEHNLDIIRAADWVIDLGPGAGPQGGRLLYAGPPEGLAACRESLTGQALESEEQVRPNTAPAGAAERGPTVIAIREARANNLKHVSVDFPKAALSVVTGISGSGKSSLVGDVLEAEARRRYLESLSMYERQGVREGPEAPVGSVSGLGVTVRLGTERGLYERRASVGTASELAHHLAVLLAFLGERDCPTCGAQMQRVRRDTSGRWRCPNCHATLPAGEPRHFMPSSYSGACRTCHGVGSLQVPAPHKLIIHPEKPLCAGAMYSPGFFPKGYLGKPGNGGYDMVMALAQRYGFDPFTTPWNQMDFAAQQAFLFGDAEPLPVHFVSKSGRAHTSIHKFPGFYGWVGEWDSGGTYTDTRACPDCGGSRLRPEFRDVRLGGHTTQQLNTIPLAELKDVLDRLASARPGDRSTAELGSGSLETARRRLHFVCRVGLGYLNLDRPAATLSAGEAQRIRLAGLLGSQLTALTVLLDEPTRGLHPSEVEALLEALRQLCAEGNTVIVVEHEAAFMRAADFLVDMGPGAGAQGGQVVSQGTPREVMQGNGLTAGWLTGARRSQAYRRTRRSPQHGWLSISGARGNNLRGEAVRFPLGLLVGVCGVSGSGKSTLVMDTLGRALAPQKQTTSVAREPLEPAPFEAIEGAPRRVVLVDQTRAGMSSPADFLNLSRPLVQLFAAGPAARATGLSAENLLQRCSACGGKGAQQIDMGFLPPVSVACETCRGTGFLPEAWSAVLQDVALPEIFNRTITEVLAFLGALPGGLPVPERLVHALDMAQAVGLGYLGLNQPGFSLSGGEAQRLKIAAELITQKAASKNSEPCLYILDEPTIGQHLEDVERLASVLHRLVDDGHTVLVVEHHPHLLAACDWLVELGPGGGPHGGQVIAAGAPEQVARGDTPIAPYLREILEPPRKDS